MKIRMLARGAVTVAAGVAVVLAVPGQAWADTNPPVPWSASTPIPAAAGPRSKPSTPVPWTAVEVTEAAPTAPVAGQRIVPVAPVVPVVPVVPVMPTVPVVGPRTVPMVPVAPVAPVVVSRGGVVSRFGVRGQVRGRVRSDCVELVSSGRGRVWLVRPGDTLGLVSGCVRVPVAVLADRNRVADPDLILVGQALVIPAWPS